MSKMVGADPDELERIGIQLERTGRRISGAGVRLGRSLQAAPWHGGNADRFRQEFASVHARSMAAAGAFLDDAYETLRRNAADQRRASETAGQSWFDRIRNWINRRMPGLFPPGWYRPILPLPRFPELPRWPNVPGGWWTPSPLFPSIPTLPWIPPGFPFGGLHPFDPKDWWDDIVIGGGAIGGGIIGLWHWGDGERPIPTTPRTMPDPIHLDPPKPPTVIADPPPPPPNGPLPGTDRSWQEVQAAYDRDYLAKYHLWPDGAPGGENQYQCVSWAWFRMRELGYDGPQVQGWGGVMAGNLGGTTATVPEPGAVMSYGSHVVVAEQITHLPDGSMQVRVSEMNVGDGDWRQGHANEYRSDRVMTRLPNGSWKGSDGGAVTVFNPNYPAGYHR